MITTPQTPLLLGILGGMLRKRIQLSLIHMAVAITLVPINSTLNRVMIKELAISATLVAILASLPYIFSPIQVLIGSYSDRHPILGWRRSPYIFLGLLMCAAGVALAPQVVFLIPEQPVLGLLVSLVVFAAWGMGFNISSVAYLSLASELSGEKGRSRTVGVMWFLMIAGIIVTAATLSRLLRDYSPETLRIAFEYVALAALVLGMLGLFRLEPRSKPDLASTVRASVPRAGWQELIRGVLANPQARHFFLYMIILLAAILGQDVLLEPYAGEAFALRVDQTTRITSIWGGCMLVALLTRLFPRKTPVQKARRGPWRAGSHRRLHLDRRERAVWAAQRLLCGRRAPRLWFRAFHRLESVLDAGYDHRAGGLVHRRVGRGRITRARARHPDRRRAA